MTWLGVPVFDWVLLVFVLGLGVEAYLTTRDRSEPPARPCRSSESSASSEADG